MGGLLFQRLRPRGLGAGAGGTGSPAPGDGRSGTWACREGGGACRSRMGDGEAWRGAGGRSAKGAESVRGAGGGLGVETRLSGMGVRGRLASAGGGEAPGEVGAAAGRNQERRDANQDDPDSVRGGEERGPGMPPGGGASPRDRGALAAACAVFAWEGPAVPGPGSRDGCSGRLLPSGPPAAPMGMVSSRRADSPAPALNVITPPDR